MIGYTKLVSKASKTDIDINELVDLISAHKMFFIKELLRKNGVPVSGNKEDLCERLHRACGNGTVKPHDALSYLDQIEGWGNQHIFLYKSPSQRLAQTWRDKSKVEKILRSNRCLGLLNKNRPILLPEKPTISSIVWTPHHLRIVWTLKRSWEERLENKDEVSEDSQVIWKAYEKKHARGTLAFDWHLGSGEAMVMIQRLPSGTKYAEERDNVADMMSGLIKLNEFQAVRISKAIKKINESGVARVRKSVLSTPAGGGASFRSAGKNRAVRDDPLLRQAVQIVATQSIGNQGNYYWLQDSDGNLDRDFHITLNANDQRVGLFGERLESEVRYVVGCIRSYC